MTNGDLPPLSSSTSHVGGKRGEGVADERVIVSK